MKRTLFRFHPQVVQVECEWGNGGSLLEIYILEGERLAVVDTGATDTPARYVAPALEAMGYSLKDVDLILNTHGHVDHAGGNANVVAASGAEVCLHEGDVEIAEDINRQFELYFAWVHQLTNPAADLDALRANVKSLADPTRVDHPLRDDEIVDLGRGIELRVVPAPGHSLGSVCFYWEREGILFTGDAVQGAGTRPQGLPMIYHPAFYEDTLARLERLDINLFCMAHYYVPLQMQRESMLFGRNGKRFIAESQTMFRLIVDQLAEALPVAGDTPFAQVAPTILAGIHRQHPLQLDVGSGQPAVRLQATLYPYWQSLGVADQRESVG